MSPSPSCDCADYYAFLLDAFARYEREGEQIHPYAMQPWRKAAKPLYPVIDAVADHVRRALAAAGRPLSDAVILEFGVWRGISIRRLARHFPTARIEGFDSFQGLPNDGRVDWRLTFPVGRLPVVPGSVRLVPGFFADTLPAFARTLAPDRAIDLVHIDCDIYSSTRTVFQNLGPWLRPGTVILFDELVNYMEFPENEFLAFYEFLNKSGLDFEWLVRVGTLHPFSRFCAPDGLKGDFKTFRRRRHYQNSSIRLVADRGKAARLATFADEARRLAALRPMRQPRAGVWFTSPPDSAATISH